MPQKDPGPPTPEFVGVFDEVRERPRRRGPRLQKRMERRAASRRPLPRKDGFQRGHFAEPPPVLDLEVERPEDRERVRGMLVRRCGTQPVWEVAPPEPPDPVPEGGRTDPVPGNGPSRDTVRPPRRGRLRRRGRPRPALPDQPPVASARTDERPRATTAELYELLEEFVEKGFAWPEPPGRKFGRKTPPSPKFAHLRSLMWLYRADYGKVVGEAKKREKSLPDDSDQAKAAAASEQWQDSGTHAEVVRQLRKVRLEHARARLDQATVDLKEARRKGAPDRVRRLVRVRRRVARLVLRRRLVHLATPLLSALAWVAVRAKFDKLDDLVFTPVGYWSSVLASVPAGAVVAGAALFDSAVVLAGAAILALGFLGMLLCVRRPWHPFAWLNDHRYMDWDPRKEKEGDDSASDHRSRGTHVLSRLMADRGQPGEVEEGTEPPGLHRLAINAFLDDLHQTYGVSGRRAPWPRRGRRYRPVLIFEAETVDRVTAYFVRLVEDERLRRSYPDPLVLVQVRGRGTPSVIESPQDPARYRVLPEASGHEPTHLSLHDWSRARQAAGMLGVTRLLRQRVGALPGSDEDLVVPTRVFTVPALTGFWSAGAAGLLAASYLVVPPLAQQHACVEEGLFVPEGITTVGGWGDRACVGLTYGDFVFDDRLEEVSEEIEKQNAAVDESDDPYVTIAYMAEMDTPGDDTYNTAGVQGELLALAMRQEERNELAEDKNTRLRFKVLLGNAGRDWEHAPDVADEIVRRAQDESLGMDRPIAGIGFGRSVRPNSDAIQRVSVAQMPILGTTATYDDVAAAGPGQPRSPYFFPIAPSNSRLAAQAANWALEGASTVKHGHRIVMDPAENAAVIANARPASDGGELEQYGPDLGRRFIEQFEAGGGEPWSPPEGRSISGGQGGGVLYYDPSGSGTLPTLREQVEEVCEEDPPDLFYYAGRSAEFGGFLKGIEGGGTAACRLGEVTVLAADDITKYAADEEEDLEANSGPPVFYTPLVPSAPWEDTAAEEHATTFYVGAEAKVDELYTEDEDEKLPSIAHAATAYDAMRVIDRALASSLVSGAPSQFLATEEHYEETRAEIYRGIGATSGNSGYLNLAGLDEGNWNPNRMVQLVSVGTEISTEFQHVVESCGMNASDSMIDDPGCIDTGASDLDQDAGQGTGEADAGSQSRS